MEGNTNLQASTFGLLWWHLLCSSGIPTAFWVAHRFQSVNLISTPHRTLLVLWVIQCPFVILLSSFFRINPRDCSYLKAVGRGVLGLFAGALVFALGAISLGAPVGSTYMLGTINWSLLMSLLTVSPAAAIFGSSWVDWKRIFAHTRPAGSVDFMVCLPAHGSIVGAWFGAWPMPLDWERPWQEWPICVTYGALVGYLIGMVASLVLGFFSRRKPYIKAD
ncbi:hypothetical protein SOVF_040480 [Spinacia oleracea]|uniref:Glycosylphosphatidylinositol anchor biosynthesis protein 11 n=1 Tax=Spinacia oleracea TaxID=3562 RepID=A0A9R0JHG8_SPIOL|nr:uncharacterized protein LOC110775015 [Spinacia oleracea]KNA21751.1 hypothetical protein SOVF_040480 [Spinacia oleracea]